MQLLQAVAKVSQELLVSDLERGIRGALRKLSEALRVERMYVLRYDNVMSEGFLISEYSAPGIETFDEVVDSIPRKVVEFEEVWKPLMADIVYKPRKSKSSSLDLEFKPGSNLKNDGFVPIFVNGIFWGAIGMGGCAVERVFREPGIQVLRVVASSVAAAVATDEAGKAQRYAEVAVNQRMKLQARLFGSLRMLFEESDLEAGLLRWLARLGGVMKANRAVHYEGCVHLPSGQASLRVIAEWVEGEINGAVAEAVDMSEAIDPHVAEEALRIISKGRCTAHHLDGLGDPMRRLFETQSEATVLVVPLRFNGQTPGAIVFTYTVRQVIDPEVLMTLEAVADACSAAIEREAEQRKLLDDERVGAAEARDMNRLMEGIVAASRALLDAPAFEYGLQSWLEYLGKTVDADHARLGGFPPTDTEESVAFTVRLWSKEAKASTQPSEQEEIPDTLDFREWAQRLMAGESIWVHRDELLDPASIRFWEEVNCYTGLIVPIVSCQRTVGWLSFDWSSRKEWKTNYRTLLRTAADSAAAAIARNEAERVLLAEREKRSAELASANQALREAIAGLASLSELDVFLMDMLRQSLAAAGADCGAIDLCEGRGIEQRIVIGGDGEQIHEFSHALLVPTVLLSAIVVLEQEQVITGLDPEDAMVPPSIREHLCMESTQSFSVVPLRVNERILGWITLGYGEVIQLSSEKATLLRLLADQITMALQFSRLANKAQAAATRSAVLSERNRLARDLHDTLAQGFAGVIAQLGAVEGAIELRQWDEATAFFERAKRLARFSLAEARSSVHALRPETNEGTVRQRIERMVSVMTQGTGLNSFVREKGNLIELSPTVDWCVYKFVQETLANAVKHSGANRFIVEIVWGKDRLSISAEDNGRGFDIDQVSEGLGILAMRERAEESGGYVYQEARKTGGTCLCLNLPIRCTESL